MKRLLREDALRKELGERGREFSSHHLWDRIAIEFEDVLNHSA
jgi:hypothetical protein